MVLKCPAYRVERNRIMGKVRRIWGGGRDGGVGGQRGGGAAQGDSIFSLGAMRGTS